MTDNRYWDIWMNTPWGWLQARYQPNQIQDAEVFHPRRWWQWSRKPATDDARVWVIREIERLRAEYKTSERVYG